MEYQLKRSRRKTCAIHIMSDGRVEVRAPLHLSQQVIEKFVHSRESWIRQKTTLQQERLQDRINWTPTQGLLLLGQEYPVEVEPGRTKAAFTGEAFLLPEGSWAEQRPAMIALYRRLAQEYLLPWLGDWAATTGLQPASTRIGSAATNWGSCSGKNTITLSWRLVLAPPKAVDYVLVHELAHLRHHNHSPAFWSLVGETLPDYRHRQALLKPLGLRLARENWKKGDI